MGSCGMESDPKFAKYKEDLNKKYKAGQVISQSSIGTAMVAKYMATKSSAVLKTINTYGKEHPTAPTKLEALNLFEKLKKSRHEGVVAVQEISTFVPGNVLTVVEEDLTKWYSLKTIWNMHGSNFSERAVGYLAYQLLQVMKHIHSLNIVHGSINLDNILCN